MLKIRRFSRHLLKMGFVIIWIGGSFSYAQSLIYTVVQGDTLYGIAKRYATTEADIVHLNSLSNSNLQLGQQLRLPQGSNQGGSQDVGATANVQAKAGAAERELSERKDISFHRVTQGETLNTLVERYQLSLETLQVSNPGLLNAFADLPLNPGLTVIVPPSEGKVVAIQIGQNLLGIALEHGMSVSDLAKANGIEKISALDAGHLLYIPSATVLERFLKDPEPVVVENPHFVWPLSGRLTSYYGHRNISVGGNTFHSGIDIATSSGTPIQAAKSGTVSRSGWGGGYGYVVFLDHSDGSQTRYAHMSNMAVDVGAVVNQSDVIGWVGSTGASTGPHLHFEIRVNGNSVDPLGYLATP